MTALYFCRYSYFSKACSQGVRIIILTNLCRRQSMSTNPDLFLTDSAARLLGSPILTRWFVCKAPQKTPEWLYQSLQHLRAASTPPELPGYKVHHFRSWTGCLHVFFLAWQCIKSGCTAKASNRVKRKFAVSRLNFNNYSLALWR